MARFGLPGQTGTLKQELVESIAVIPDVPATRAPAGIQ